VDVIGGVVSWHSSRRGTNRTTVAVISGAVLVALGSCTQANQPPAARPSVSSIPVPRGPVEIWAPKGEALIANAVASRVSDRGYRVEVRVPGGRPDRRTIAALGSRPAHGGLNTIVAFQPGARLAAERIAKTLVSVGMRSSSLVTNASIPVWATLGRGGYEAAVIVYLVPDLPRPVEGPGPDDGFTPEDISLEIVDASKIDGLAPLFGRRMQHLGFRVKWGGPAVRENHKPTVISFREGGSQARKSATWVKENLLSIARVVERPLGRTEVAIRIGDSAWRPTIPGNFG
jgi:hypothetical protein